MLIIVGGSNDGVLGGIGDVAVVGRGAMWRIGEVGGGSNDGGGNSGSDYALFQLNNAIPQSYNAFYNGWNVGEFLGIL